MNRICTICARCGSKGLPGKNLKTLMGRPLIAHAIEQARHAGLFEAVVVSSDSDDILAAARKWGARHLVRRPAMLATDSAPKLPAIQHCVQVIEDKLRLTFDLVVDLDPTSPLRLPDDVKGAVALIEERRVSSVITGAPSRKSPYFNLVERDESGAVRLCKPLPDTVHRRQKSPPCFDMNAAVYVWKRNVFMNNPRVFYEDTLLYEMPTDRSHDIDTPLDFEFVEFLMRRRAAVKPAG